MPRMDPVRRTARALLGCAALVASAGGCIDREAAAVAPRTESSVTLVVPSDGIDKVDLLLEVDNSGSMEQDQLIIAAQLRPLIATLTNPPDDDHDGVPDHPAVHDLHVGVISQDLGTRGVHLCSEGTGDDGVLDPLARGGSASTHVPTLGREGCPDPSMAPPFLSFASGSTDPTGFGQSFQCSAVLGRQGCGLEQQLEAVYRALVVHHAGAAEGDSDPNAGFLRPDALLAIVMLTDEEDGSVRDCQYAEPGDTACDDARSVWDAGSTARWGSYDPNMRMYMYAPGSAQDPTWPLDRYVDPRNLSRGLLGLKPGHPERIVFAAITGVPLALPTRANGSTDWDALLGAPGANGPDDFAGRDTSTAVDTMTADGPVSMRQAHADPTCVGSTAPRVVPVCERWTGTPAASVPCSLNSATSYFAVPSRRVTEIARRFDEDPLCNGQPCHNGLVTSICNRDYASATRQIVAKIGNLLSVPCLPRALHVDADATGQQTVQCRVRETLPPGLECDASPSLQPAQDTTGQRLVATDPDGTQHAVCDLAQVATDATGMPVSGEGWYYQHDPSGPDCAQQVLFTSGAQPPNGTVVRLECLQSVTGPGTGTTGM